MWLPYQNERAEMYGDVWAKFCKKKKKTQKKGIPNQATKQRTNEPSKRGMEQHVRQYTQT